MFALNIDTATGRILSATFEQYASGGMPVVDTLPEGDVADYLYVNDTYVSDPLPSSEEPTEPVTTLENRVTNLEETVDVMLTGGGDSV